MCVERRVLSGVLAGENERPAVHSVCEVTQATDAGKSLAVLCPEEEYVNVRVKT